MEDNTWIELYSTILTATYCVYHRSREDTHTHTEQIYAQMIIKTQQIKMHCHKSIKYFDNLFSKNSASTMSRLQHHKLV